jgi:hypothetical protein
MPAFISTFAKATVDKSAFAKVTAEGSASGGFIRLTSGG